MSLARFDKWVVANKPDKFVSVRQRLLKSGRVELTLGTTHNSKGAYVFRSSKAPNRFMGNKARYLWVIHQCFFKALRACHI